VTVPIAELARAGLSPARTLGPLVNASIFFAGAAVALQICYPLVHDSTRDRVTAAVVVTFAIAATLHAAGAIGVARGLAVVAISVWIGFVAEVAGVHSGLPFGSYRYADTLGPRLAGVPIIVGLAWAMMTWPAAVVARRLARTRISQVVIGAWALASWDLFLDPQMVAAGHWFWRDPIPHLPGVPTVPLTNLLGWLLVSIVVSLAGQCVVGSRSVRPDGPMLALYLWTYASSVLALVAFLGLSAAALWGALGMGLVALPLAVTLVRHR
jgi:putative membrane protein